MKKNIISTVVVVLVITALCIIGSSILKKNYYFSIETPFKCTLDYLVLNTDEKKLDQFIKLDSIDVYREWGNLTGHLAESNHILKGCGLYKHMYENEVNLDSLKGRMIFIYYMHGYLKDGYVDKEAIRKEVDNLMTTMH